MKTVPMKDKTIRLVLVIATALILIIALVVGY